MVKQVANAELDACTRKRRKRANRLVASHANREASRSRRHSVRVRCGAPDVDDIAFITGNRSRKRDRINAGTLNDVVRRNTRKNRIGRSGQLDSILRCSFERLLARH